MANKEKKIKKLLELGYKKKEIKLFRRKEIETEEEYKQGMVVGVPDKSVPFDGARNEEQIKNAIRPCLVLSANNSNKYKRYYKLSPGTSTPHINNDEECVLVAEVPPEKLLKTTYFLLHFQWTASSHIISGKICNLSPTLIEKLKSLI